jgi:hypothetical protein
MDHDDHVRLLRAGVPGSGAWAELGSGTGAYVGARLLSGKPAFGDAGLGLLPGTMPGGNQWVEMIVHLGPRKNCRQGRPT